MNQELGTFADVEALTDRLIEVVNSEPSTLVREAAMSILPAKHAFERLRSEAPLIQALE